MNNAVVLLIYQKAGKGKEKNPQKGHIQEVLVGRTTVQKHEDIQLKAGSLSYELYRLQDYLSEVAFYSF